MIQEVMWFNNCGWLTFSSDDQAYLNLTERGTDNDGYRVQFMRGDDKQDNRESSVEVEEDEEIHEQDEEEVEEEEEEIVYVNNPSRVRVEEITKMSAHDLRETVSKKISNKGYKIEYHVSESYQVQLKKAISDACVYL